jgi:hypothetical protein
MANMQRNMGFWFGSGYFGAIGNYEPDFNALRKVPVRIVSAVGDESRGARAHQGGGVLGKRLGSAAVVFPGAHGGASSHAAEFAGKLREVFEA